MDQQQVPDGVSELRPRRPDLLDADPTRDDRQLPAMAVVALDRSPMSRRSLKGLAFVLALCIVPALASAHPLDPLTPDEIRAAARIARMDARLSQAKFASILLNEPAKAQVNAWRPGQ